MSMLGWARESSPGENFSMSPTFQGLSSPFLVLYLQSTIISDFVCVFVRVNTVYTFKPVKSAFKRR